MVYCSYCGVKNRDGDSHCFNCGEQLPLVSYKGHNIPHERNINQQNSIREDFHNQILNDLSDRNKKDNNLRNNHNYDFRSEINNPRLDNMQNNFQDTNQEEYFESQLYNRNYNESTKTVDKTAVEWDVVIATALIVIILSAILQRIFPLLSIFMALCIGLIYILLATKSKLSLFKSIPLTVLMILAVSAYFSL